MIEPLKEMTEEGAVVLRQEVRSHAHGFLSFIRERGVTGLAVGFVLGTSVQKVVTSFVTDIASPAVGIVMGRAERIETLQVGPFLIGNFIASLADFLLLVFIIYLVFTFLRLEWLDKQNA